MTAVLQALTVQLVLCLGVTATLGLALRHRPITGVSLALILWALLPAVAAYHVTGHPLGPLAIHPATWLSVFLALGSLVFHPSRMAEVVTRHPYTALVVTVFVLGAGLDTVLAGENVSGGVKELGDQIVGPLLLFWLVVAHARESAQLRLLRNTVIAIGVVESALALVQFRAGALLVYENDFTSLSWFDPDKFTRWMGTTDSPLLLSLTACVAAPLVVEIRRTWLRLGMFAVLGLGVVITQSRVGAGVMALLLLYVILRARTGWLVRSASLFLLGLAVYVLLGSSLISGLTSRLNDDSGSAGARELAVKAFLVMARSRIFTGDGLSASYGVAHDAGLQTSLESSVLMYAVDVGLVLAVSYFGLQVVLALRSAPGNRVPGICLAAVTGCLVQHTFSAAAYSNLSSALLWVVVGVAVAAGREPVSPGIRTGGTAQSRVVETPPSSRMRLTSSGV